MRQTQPVPPKLNILSFCFDEKHELLVTNTGNNIFAITVPGFLYKWNPDIMTKPLNYTLFEFHHNADLITHLPASLDFDLIVAFERPSQFEIAKKISKVLQIPIAVIENRFPISVSDAFSVSAYSNMTGSLNVFGNSYLKSFWNVSGESEVLMPGVNTSKFTPEEGQRSNKVLTVVNNFIQRDEETSFSKWKAIVEGFEIALVGHNPGIASQFTPFSSLHKTYQASKVYLNTTTGGIFPIEVIEAMASGCAVVTLDFIGMRDFIKSGENGFICKTVDEARAIINKLHTDKDLFTKISSNARSFVVNNCDLSVQSSKLNARFKDIVIKNREKVYES